MVDVHHLIEAHYRDFIYIKDMFSFGQDKIAINWRHSRVKWAYKTCLFYLYNNVYREIMKRHKRLEHIISRTNHYASMLKIGRKGHFVQKRTDYPPVRVIWQTIVSIWLLCIQLV